jgi:hypothetical protein
MKLLISIAIATAGIAVLNGCSESSDLSKSDDEALRKNMSRPLNAQELSQMGQAKEAPRAGNTGPSKF